MLGFWAAGGAAWLVLHPATGWVLRKLAKRRLGDSRVDLMEQSINMGFRVPVFMDQIDEELAQDMVYQFFFLSLFLLKWCMILGISWAVIR